jgi:hypothetical protein
VPGFQTRHGLLRGLMQSCFYAFVNHRLVVLSAPWVFAVLADGEKILKNF